MYSHRRISDDRRLIIDMHATYTYMYSHRRISDDRRLIIDMHATCMQHTHLHVQP